MSRSVSCSICSNVPFLDSRSYLLLSVSSWCRKCDQGKFIWMHYKFKRQFWMKLFNSLSTIDPLWNLKWSIRIKQYKPVERNWRLSNSLIFDHHKRLPFIPLQGHWHFLYCRRINGVYKNRKHQTHFIVYKRERESNMFNKFTVQIPQWLRVEGLKDYVTRRQHYDFLQRKLFSSTRLLMAIIYISVCWCVCVCVSLCCIYDNFGYNFRPSCFR